MIRGGGKKKARNRRIGSRQLIRVSPRKRVSRVQRWPSPKTPSPKRYLSGVARRKTSIPVKTAYILASAAAASAGTYSKPTEFFLNSVAACNQHNNVCFKKAREVTMIKFPKMTGPQMGELNWAISGMNVKGPRDNLLKGRGKRSGGAKLPDWMKSMQKFKETSWRLAKWTAAGVAATGAAKALSRQSAMGSVRDGPSLPSIMYSHHGPWK